MTTNFVPFFLILFSLTAKPFLGQSNNNDFHFFYALEVVDLKPNKNLVHYKIRSGIVYNYQEEFSRHNLVRNTKYFYDKKGRIIKFRKYNFIEDTISYTVKLNWKNDSIIEAMIIYDHDYDKEKKYDKFDQYSNWVKTYSLSYQKIGKKYAINTQIILNDQHKISRLITKDSKGDRFETNFMQLPSTYLTFHNYDSIISDNKVSTLSELVSWENTSETILDTSKCTYRTNMYIYTLDSLGRITKRINRKNLLGKEFTSKTIYKYNPNGKVELIEDIGITQVFRGYRHDYSYNSKGEIVFESYDKNEDDSLVDYTKSDYNDTTIITTKWLQIMSRETQYVVSLEEIIVQGILKKTSYHKNDKPSILCSIYYYKRRFAFLKTKMNSL